jgi:hypothetical protein
VAAVHQEPLAFGRAAERAHAAGSIQRLHVGQSPPRPASRRLVVECMPRPLPNPEGPYRDGESGRRGHLSTFRRPDSILPTTAYATGMAA